MWCCKTGKHAGSRQIGVIRLHCVYIRFCEKYTGCLHGRPSGDGSIARRPAAPRGQWRRPIDISGERRSGMRKAGRATQGSMPGGALLPGALPGPCDNGHPTGLIRSRQPAGHRRSLIVYRHSSATMRIRLHHAIAAAATKLQCKLRRKLTKETRSFFCSTINLRVRVGNWPKRVSTRRGAPRASRSGIRCDPCPRALEARRSWNSGRSDQLSSGRLDSDRILGQPGRAVSWPCSC
jgi:hypothetical protein